MAHNTREVEEIVAQLLLRTYDRCFVRGRVPPEVVSSIAHYDLFLKEELTNLLHHQLQKARQDWLREEIVRLEGMKNIVGSQTEISSNESLVKMVKNVMELKGEMAYNQALQTIIDRYQSELDQPNK